LEVRFTEEISDGIPEKLDFLSRYDPVFKDFFSGKKYGNDIDILCIGIFCMSPRFEKFFSRKKKPMYYVEPKTYIHKGIQVSRPGKWFQYELRLNFDLYMQEENVKILLSNDIINSLPVIKSVKKVKDFDLDRFKSDLISFFEMHWR
jgi:hypothetical protein